MSEMLSQAKLRSLKTTPNPKREFDLRKTETGNGYRINFQRLRKDAGTGCLLSLFYTHDKLLQSLQLHKII